MHKKIAWFALVILFAAIDQMSKIAVAGNFIYGMVYPFVPMVNLQVVYNYGISFSWFNTEAFYYLIVAFGLIITLGLMIWLVKIPSQAKLKLSAVTLILGGAIGNLVDRIFRGYVIDFIDFSIGSWHWYNFNLADLWISIGAFFMIVDLLINKETHKDSNKNKEVPHGNHLS
jgi:signal peptidase II